MTGIDELRRTLDTRAHEVTDTGLPDRVTSVRSRVRTVRRRRAAGVVVAAVLGVGTATGVALLPGGGPAPAPVADRTVLGEEAPPSLDSLGWTYEFATASSSEGGTSVSTEVEASDRPRLVSWTTAGADQDVSVRIRGAEPWVSDAGDFDDFAWIPPGYAGDVRVDAEAPGVGLAIYELDASRPPAGVTAGGVTFREGVAGQELVDATVGDLGDVDVSVDLTVPRHTLSVAHTCSGAPRGAVVNISLDGSDQGVVMGECDATFDPGGHAGSSFPEGIGVRPGERTTARIWLSRSIRDPEPVDPADFPDARLGLGVYALPHPGLRVAGTEVPSQVESRGRTWTMAGTQQAAGAEVVHRLVPRHGATHMLATVARHTTGPARFRIRVDGRPAGTDQLTGAGRSAVGELLLPPVDREVRVTADRGAEHVRRLGVALYVPIR